MDIIGVKTCSGLLFLVLALVFGWLPFYIHQRLSQSTTTSSNISTFDTKRMNKGGGIIRYLHFLASGVLIATCLLHLLPECLEAVQEGLKARSSAILIKLKRPEYFGNQSTIVDANKSETEGEEISFYPVAELLIALGFISVYMLDNTIKTVQSHHSGNKRNYRKIHENTEEVRYEKVETESSSDNDEFVRARDKTDCDYEQCKEVVNIMLQQSETSDINRNFTCCTLHAGNKNYDVSSSKFHPIKNGKIQSTVNMSENCTSYYEKELREEENAVKESQNSSYSKDEILKDSVDIRSTALVVALCVHGFFDGVMLGLQSSVNVILTLLFALSLHKTFVSISLSLTLVKNYHIMTALDNNKLHHYSSHRLRYLVYVILFASTAPLGLLTSAAFIHSGFTVTSSDASDVSMAPGCLQAFAVGTFLYVVFTETTERHDTADTTLKSEVAGHVFLLMGFASMASLRAAFGETG